MRSSSAQAPRMPPLADIAWVVQSHLTSARSLTGGGRTFRGRNAARLSRLERESTCIVEAKNEPEPGDLDGVVEQEEVLSLSLPWCQLDVRRPA